MSGSKQIPEIPKTAPNCAGTAIFFPAAPFIPEDQNFKLPERVDRIRCRGVGAVSDPIIDYHRLMESTVTGGTVLRAAGADGRAIGD
jgi:hypothetical protein